MSTSRTWFGRVFIAMSLDGYIARLDGTLDWLNHTSTGAHAGGASSHPAVVWETFFPSVDSIVMGRGTYEAVVGFDRWPFAGKDVIVLSTTLSVEDHRVRLARDLEEACALLEEVGAAQVYVDGGRTIQSFLTAGYVDEITVSIAPILLGQGKRLFGELPRDVMLTVRGQHLTAADGLVRITYDVGR